MIRLPRPKTVRFNLTKHEALSQCDELGLGFYGKEYPIFVKMASFVPRDYRMPEMTSAVKWVWDLFDGRLWHRRPTCVGFMATIIKLKNDKHMGTEIILERRDF